MKKKKKKKKNELAAALIFFTADISFTDRIELHRKLTTFL